MGLVRKIKAGLVKVSVNDFVGEDGNIFFDIDDGVLRLSDGATPGGIPLASGGSEGSTSTFRQLLDTPSSFSGTAGNFVKVNAHASALEFVDVDLFDGDYNNLTNLPTLFNPSDITQSLVPRTDVAIDLGTSTKKWRDLYLSGNTIFLGNAIIRNVDGTVELPANAKVNGRRIPIDIRDLDDVDNLLSSVSVTSYNDLTDLPVLFSGNYNDLTNTPTIPRDISDLTDNNNLLSGSGQVDDSYVLPIATNNTLGGIRIGSGLSIDATGVVSVTVNRVTSYNDLTDTPDLTVYQLTANAFSGSYVDLTNKPTIPTVPTTISSFTNDSGYITGYAVTQADVTRHQTALTITESQISDLKSYLTTVAFADLTSTPTTLSGYGITDAFNGDYNSLLNLPILFDGAYTSLSGTPDLTVYQLAANAFSGSYLDLTNKPTLITSYNDLTDLPVLFDGAYGSLTDVPTTVSSFTNDVGYLTTVAFVDLTATPTTLSGYGIIDAYTTTQVDSAISTAVNNILDGAPELLDTLNEIAAAVGDDPNFITTINNAVDLKANSADLAVVATTGSYNDLSNTPAIPADISDLTDVNNVITGSNITEDDLITYSILFG